MMPTAASFHDLNGLQQMMLRWEEIHPLNALHVIELGEPVTETAAQSALDRAVETLRLGRVEFSRDRTRSRYVLPSSEAGPRIESWRQDPERTLALPGDPSRSALLELLEDHLNRPFARSGSNWPFRFIHLTTIDGRCYLGVVYRHAVSDSQGIQKIVRCWLRMLYGLTHPGEPLRTDAPALKLLYPEELSWKRLPARMREIAVELHASRDCYRATPKLPGTTAISGALHGRHLPLAAIRGTARREGVTIQDAVFAAMVEGLRLLFDEDMESQKRSTLALYAAADIRREAGVDLDNVLGQFLGAITVRIKGPAGRPFSEIAADVTRQSRAIKSSREHLAHASHLQTMARLWDLCPMSINRSVGPRLFPVMSLISNVNLTDFFAREIAAGFVVDYHRFTGTGILTPMMTGFTTVGSHVNLTTTRHAEIFSADQQHRLMRHVERRLTGQLPEIATQAHFEAEQLSRDDTRDLPTVQDLSPNGELRTRVG
jgi:hypothetical protein